MIGMRTLFGIIAFGIALYCVAKAIEKQREINACNGCKITATIVGNNMQLLGNGICVYYPIYSYEMDGETMAYQSKSPSATTLRLGMQVPMYYNHAKRTPVEAISSITEIVLAIMFICIAMFCLCV